MGGQIALRAEVAGRADDPESECCCQMRLTITRAVRGFDGLAIASASSRRSLPRSKRFGSAGDRMARKCGGAGRRDCSDRRESRRAAPAACPCRRSFASPDTPEADPSSAPPVVRAVGSNARARRRKGTGRFSLPPFSSPRNAVHRYFPACLPRGRTWRGRARSGSL